MSRLVLIIHKTGRGGQELAEMFRFTGMLAYAVNAHEALSEISTRYRAVLILDAGRLPDAADYLRRLRSYAASVPVFSVHMHEGEDMSADGLFDDIFLFESPADCIYRIIKYTTAHGLPSPGDYRLAGMNASCGVPKLTVFGKGLHVQPTRMRIIRYLFRAYPTRVGAPEIVKHLYAPSKRPFPADIRTHVCAINKLFRAEYGRALIDVVKGEGYRIFTGAEETEALTL